MIGPVFEALSTKFPNLLFFKVDVDACQARQTTQALRGRNASAREALSTRPVAACLGSLSPRSPGRRCGVRHQRDAHLPGLPGQQEGASCAREVCVLVLTYSAQVDELVGASKDNLEKLIEKYAA
jgi:hypothetical protein